MPNNTSTWNSSGSQATQEHHAKKRTKCFIYLLEAKLCHTLVAKLCLVTFARTLAFGLLMPRAIWNLQIACQASISGLCIIDSNRTIKLELEIRYMSVAAHVRTTKLLTRDASMLIMEHPKTLLEGI